jgi:thiamine pyrophosphate-dependent acetolactate synthase large subunit-like protein
MADGYARIGGKPGFVYGQYGPGVSNVAAGLANPYWSMSPVISFTTSMRTQSRDRYEYQELDQLPRWNKKEALNRSLPGERTTWVRQATERVQAWKEEVQRLASRSPKEPIHPAAVISALRAALDPMDIVVADTGYMGAWTGAAFSVTAPGRQYIRVAGSLGWA